MPRGVKTTRSGRDWSDDTQVALGDLIETCLEESVDGVRSASDLDIFLAATFDPKLNAMSRNHPPDDPSQVSAWVIYTVRRNWAEVPFACGDVSSMRCLLVVLSAARGAEAADGVSVPGFPPARLKEIIGVGRELSAQARRRQFDDDFEPADMQDIVPDDLLVGRDGIAMRAAMNDCIGGHQVHRPSSPRELQAYRGLRGVPSRHGDAGQVSGRAAQLEWALLEEDVYCGVDGYDLECESARLGVLALAARLDGTSPEQDDLHRTESFIDDLMEAAMEAVPEGP